MKKTLALILTLALSLAALTGCGSKTETPADTILSELLNVAIGLFYSSIVAVGVQFSGSCRHNFNVSRSASLI